MTRLACCGFAIVLGCAQGVTDQPAGDGGDLDGPPTTMHTVTVARAGDGTGTVTSVPAGIDCGADCSEAFAAGSAVTLTAVAATGSTFTGWSGGGCTGTGPCALSLAGSVIVTATFARPMAALTVVNAGAGTGTITSAPAGIDCGATCTASFALGAVVTLTAAPTAGAIFAGWNGGGCTGTGSCAVTLSAATTVTATFTTMGNCDAFTSADTTTIAGWTERAGDWVISANRLRDATGTTGTVYSRHLTKDGSTQGDGCVRFQAIYNGAATVASAGAVLRWSPPATYVVALVQDNTNAGNWNTTYIYQYPGITDIGNSGSMGAFGLTPNVEACVTGSTVTLRVDANGDGTYEHTHLGTTTITAAGLSGLMSLSASAAIDNFCWGP